MTCGANKPLLADPTAEACLQDLGFVVIPFLEAEEVAMLRTAYWHRAPAAHDGMVVDYMMRDRSAMHRTRELVEPVFNRQATRHLRNPRLVLATFVVKHPGGWESAFFLHDDRSYVDERLQRTATAWIPLVDVGHGLDNGGLQVVPRSHRLATGLAGSLTPDLIRPYEAYLRERLVMVDVPAGHALVYDTRVLHASPENRSGRPREALALAIAPRDIPLLHVVATGRRHRRIHAVDEGFFLDHHVREIEVAIGPEYPIVAEYDDFHELRPDEVAMILGPTPDCHVVLPSDLIDEVPVVDLRPLPSHPAGSLDPDQGDLAIRARDLGGGGGPATPLIVEEGCASHTAVRRSFRRRTHIATKEVLRRAPMPRTAADADVIVLDPGARIVLTVPSDRFWSHHLTIAECPVVGAGVRSGRWAMNLEPHSRIELPGGRRLTAWNEGPGPLAAVLSRSPSVLLRGASALRRFARGRRRPRGSIG